MDRTYGQVWRLSAIGLRTGILVLHAVRDGCPLRHLSVRPDPCLCGKTGVCGGQEMQADPSGLFSAGSCPFCVCHETDTLL